ncbi:hypothetical protein UFOVP225_28 [uncultured Caudovirales phage]|uniref:Uncharacterized protein n=1 Tax=uncultured Caudovirales phage TaxID=2100421 RepID=A0A6J5L114_9CAUD|nr:hypothetical protein UFOVP113_41 [uncultured Caudovirales phage]CAB5219131.1 hypothetical protein UFOVP225_28 [uncultured Caudovirales phage]
MLTDSNIEFTYEGTPGVPLTWVIDEQCLYDLALSQEHAAIFQTADEVIDISDQYPDHPGITVSFRKNGEVLDTFQTTDYFGSILLSEPLVLNMLEYAYGLYVVSPNALFQNNEFVILDQDVSGREKFHG